MDDNYDIQRQGEKAINYIFANVFFRGVVRAYNRNRNVAPDTSIHELYCLESRDGIIPYDEILSPMIQILQSILHNINYQQKIIALYSNK